MQVTEEQQQIVALKKELKMAQDDVEKEKVYLRMKATV